VAVKILVRATNWLGDAVMSIPALRAIRGRWPKAELTILARQPAGEIFAGQGLCDRDILFEHTGRHRGVLGAERLAGELRREKFDCALLLQNAFQAAWIARRAGIAERIGYDRDARGWLLTKPIPLPRPGEIPAHECYYYLELVRRAGWLDRLPEVDEILLHVEPAAVESARERLRAAGARAGALAVALAPGAAYGSAKCWMPERFAQLADRLIAEFGADVIIFGAAGEQDIATRIAGAMKHRPVALAGQTRAGELPALFAACDLFIGNDSGAVHVAGAVGLPVVAIFGPTDPQGTSPVTERRSLVRREVACSPCFLRHCPVDHRCMTRVEVTEVFLAAQKWLSEGARAG